MPIYDTIPIYGTINQNNIYCYTLNNLDIPLCSFNTYFIPIQMLWRPYNQMFEIDGAII